MSKQTVDLKVKTEQATLDKHELMRDLATYEHNLSNNRNPRIHTSLKEKLAEINARI